MLSRITKLIASRRPCSSSVDINVEILKPSLNFIKSLRGEDKEKYEKTAEQFDVFAYMGKYVPTEMNDDDWRKSVEFSSLDDKVAFWEFLAIKQRRREGRDKRKNQNSEAFDRYIAEEEKKYNNGEMGYGPGLYQLIQNPMRNKKKVHHIEGNKVYESMRVGVPKVALDLQFVPSIAPRNRSELGNQMQYSISENFSAKRPLEFDFVNLPNEEFVESWISKSIGYYGGTYCHQTILPGFTTKGIKEYYGPDKKIIYISNYARDVLDGPIDADVISVAVTMDNKRESLGAARRAGIRAFRLPFHRYVKWKSGPQFLPFPNLLNVFRQVYDSNGDWKTALLNNISRRHLITADDSEYLKKQQLIRKARNDEKKELIEMIKTATGS